jgi:hypothetical protein
VFCRWGIWLRLQHTMAINVSGGTGLGRPPPTIKSSRCPIFHKSTSPVSWKINRDFLGLSHVSHRTSPFVTHLTILGRNTGSVAALTEPFGQSDLDICHRMKCIKITKSSHSCSGDDVRRQQIEKFQTPWFAQPKTNS